MHVDVVQESKIDTSIFKNVDALTGADSFMNALTKRMVCKKAIIKSLATFVRHRTEGVADECRLERIMKLQLKLQQYTSHKLLGAEQVLVSPLV